jgi:hypothetical protein
MMRRLLNLLMRRRLPRRELFVHEDDWGQIEVLPALLADWLGGSTVLIAAEQTSGDGGELLA